MIKGDKMNEIEIEIIERHVIKICFQQKFLNQNSKFLLEAKFSELKCSDFYLNLKV